MYICERCQREYNDKPNGRCVNCGGLVRKVFDKRDNGRNNRKRFQNARRFKQGEWD